jgi:thioester reductase-like protein
LSIHLLTGFPGFIGRRLATGLLDGGGASRLVALVEPRMMPVAREAAARIEGEGIELLAGDITRPRLGLADHDYGRLTAEVSVVHHLAAIYDLGVPLEVAQRVNVDGTGNVLALCRECEQLERLNYVSTAYVAGERTGTVYEHELLFGQRFKNHYESTKFQAEVWVREELERIPTTIFRPAIVVGDSRTGETQKFDGPYYVLRFIGASARRGIPIANIGRGSAPFNVVPVDFIVDAMVAVGSEPAAIGETLHLCDPDPLSAAELFGLLCRTYAGVEPRLRVPPRLVSAALGVPPLRRFFGGAPPESIRYLNHPVRYDTRRADELLGRHGLRCPPFGAYAPAMVEFFRANESDPVLLGEA